MFGNLLPARKYGQCRHPRPGGKGLSFLLCRTEATTGLGEPDADVVAHARACPRGSHPGLLFEKGISGLRVPPASPAPAGPRPLTGTTTPSAQPRPRRPRPLTGAESLLQTLAPPRPPHRPPLCPQEASCWPGCCGCRRGGWRRPAQAPACAIANPR